MQKIRGPELVPNVPVKEQDRAQREDLSSLGIALIFTSRYAVRSSPSVMIPQLAAAFRTTALGVGSILVLITTPIRLRVWSQELLSINGSKRPVATGAAILAADVCCLAFSSVMAEMWAACSKVLDLHLRLRAPLLRHHADSSAVAWRQRSARLSVLMLGGAAGQFAVGPMIARGLM